MRTMASQSLATPPLFRYSSHLLAAFLMPFPIWFVCLMPAFEMPTAEIPFSFWQNAF